MKKHFDIYVPKIQYETALFWGETPIFISTTLPDKVIHPEPRVVDLSNKRN